MAEPRVPRSTYRLQFNKGFRFGDARALVSYLAELGVSDLYASPLLHSRPGSLHGYDVTRPDCLDPELGSQADFDSLVAELHGKHMGLLLDIVPNHMAASSGNVWWMDVLKYGRSSPYADFFDLVRQSEGEGESEVLLPILGTWVEEAIKQGEIKLHIDSGALFVDYYETSLPAGIRSYPVVLSYALRRGGHRLPPGPQRELDRIITKIDALPPGLSGHRARAAAHRVERRLDSLMARDEVRLMLENALQELNRSREDPETTEVVRQFLAGQQYQLAFWRRAAEEIRYRRFFDITDLIALRMDRPKVFRAVHDLVLGLARRGKVTGLRIDHIDGLRDPLQYLRRLQTHLEPEHGNRSMRRFYVVVEKILAEDERLPDEWPVFGTTGYDFTNQANALLVDSDGIERLSDTYRSFTGYGWSFDEVVVEKKKLVMQKLFPGDLRRLVREAARALQESGLVPAARADDLEESLVMVTACLPVYRTYVRNMHVSPSDRKYIEEALAASADKAPGLKESLTALGRMLLLRLPAGLSREVRRRCLDFVMDWQQFTGPVMAKGYEDTALYNYSRLVSLNEVGGNPGGGDMGVPEFHKRNTARLSWPHTLNATSTHDTKRGEDMRARIDVLSEIPQEWSEHVIRWRTWNSRYRKEVGGVPVPDPDMEMLLYQTMLGAWPFELDRQTFLDRMKQYAVKASREAKLRTDWLDPDEGYENGLLDFVDSILSGPTDSGFLADFLPFQRRVAFFGMLNSLSLVVLKVCSPGVPDIYQGTELWDLSLVDPDNRRAVDFELRRRYLEEIAKRRPDTGLVAEILRSWRDGRVKLFALYSALKVRAQLPEVFASGDYLPLDVQGKHAANICAFARHRNGSWVVIAVPRLCTRLVSEGDYPLGIPVWDDTSIVLPPGCPQRWQDRFTGKVLAMAAPNHIIVVGELFSHYPVSLLVAG